MLELHLLGRFQVFLDGQPVTIPERPAQSLIAYLALNTGTEHRREKLAGLLWPDSSETDARSYLRHALWRVRKSIKDVGGDPDRYVQVSEISLSITTDSPVWVDARELLSTTEAPPAKGVLPDVLALYEGELLPGFFDDWTFLERERIRSHFQRLMRELLDRLLHQKRWREAEEWGERWISLGEVPEPAYRAVMVAQAGSGDRSAAVATYQRAVADLERELGLEPSPLLRSTFDELTQPIPRHAVRRDRLRDFTGHLRGELRDATIQHAELVGVATPTVPADLESLKEILDDSMGVLVDRVLAYDGTIVRVENDGLLACFGAPVAHEDDSKRALMAALDMREEFRSSRHHEVSIRIGVETGKLLVSELGWDMRLGYSAVGQAVDTAASLRGYADGGEILVGEAAQSETAHFFEYGPARKVDVENGDQIQCHPLLGVASLTPAFTDTRQSPHAGREKELDTLLNLLDTEKRGAVFVVGEPGIGKTRLLEEARSRRGGVRWGQGRSQSFGANLPYHALGEALRSLIASDDRPAGSASEPDLTQVFAGLGEDQRTRYEMAVRTVVDTQAPGLTGADIEHADVAEAVLALLREVGRDRPSVLVVEDLHWVDGATIVLIREALEKLDAIPVLMILSMRPVRDTPAWMMREDVVAAHPCSIEEIYLDPLDQSAMADLADAEGPLPRPVKDLLIRRSQGNPFFFEELHRRLIDEKVLIRRDGHWVLERDLVESDVPPTVQKVILARTDRLPEPERWVLQAASVVGMQFQQSILEVVSEMETRQSLDMLATEDFIRLTSLDPEPTYVFRHALIRDAIYSTLLKADRRKLHLSVGAALESSPSSEDHAGLLVYHYVLAGEPQRAQPFSAAMAQNAWKAMAPQQSASLELALQQDPPPELALRLLLSLARARFTGADIKGSVDAYEKATQLAREINDLSTKAETTVYAAMTRWQATEPRESRWPYLESAIRDVADDPTSRGKLLLLQEVARQYLAAGDIEEAKTLLMEARSGLETWHGQGRADLESHLLNTEGLVASREGRFEAGHQLLRRALELGQQSESLVATSRSRTNLATTLFWVYGELDEGLAWIEETRDTIALRGIWATFVEETVHLARFHWGQGDIERGLAEIDLLESSLRGQPTWLSLDAAKAPLLAAVGDAGLALSAARDGWESRQRTGDELLTAHAGLSMGRSLAYAGQPTEAVVFLERAATAANGAPALRSEILSEWIYASVSSDESADLENIVELIEETPDVSPYVTAWKRIGLAMGAGDSGGVLRSADYLEAIGQEHVAWLTRFRVSRLEDSSELVSIGTSAESWADRRGLVLY